MADNYPNWMAGGRLNEIAFCDEFLEKQELVFCDGAFFTTEGLLPEEKLRQQIFQEIRPHICSGVARRVEQLLGALRLAARGSLQNRWEQLNVANGTYDAQLNIFSGYKQCCRNRLPVNYNYNAPKPEKWLAFLQELLEPEDIVTLQEFMGYCLVPTTAAQKMLMIIGEGGEGKSRIGVVMRSLLGNNMNQGSIAKVETNAFARADLQHKLLLVDDDLRMEALPSTHYLKSIITAELPMDLEKKGIQSYQGLLNVRFLAFGNGSLRALHDRSFGFFRRQIVLTARPRDHNRVDNPYLGDQLTQEKEGILLWCIEGLRRLVTRDFQFTTSLRTNGKFYETMLESNNILLFLGSEGYFRYDPEGYISSRQFYTLYRDWCEDNALTAYSANTFWSFMSRTAPDCGITYSNNVPIGNGRKARGFKGLRPLPRL